jgi:UDP-galactopyranose mutase
MNEAPVILCFSHLRWTSVFQRPHHLLSRLACHYPVYVIEEPVPIATEQPFMTTTAAGPNLTVCQPHVRTHWSFFSGDGADQVTGLVRDLLRRQGMDNYVFWYYTPMALHVTRGFAPRAVVYDCMDELSRFRHAPAELADLERELLGQADLVFAGGPSLWAAKRRQRLTVHLFPSSVETDHFAQALTGGVAVDPATAARPSPRLGYYGVIDERLDLSLLDGLAAARPDWQIMMVGPVVKIDAASLPTRPNLHFLGQADYRDLPAHLAGWQVALMPFALNEATEFISPTKTLEYMAAGRPIVSTPITDVAQPYGTMVAIAHDLPSFVNACEQALAEDVIRRRRRLAAYAGVLERTSWDRTAASMQVLLADIVGPPRSASSQSAAATPALLPTPGDTLPAL